MDIPFKKGFVFSAIGVAIAALFIATFANFAQETQGRQEYQAQAMGQGTQLGQNFKVTLIINEYSGPERIRSGRSVRQRWFAGGCITP
jgi:hypothetical protein